MMKPSYVLLPMFIVYATFALMGCSGTGSKIVRFCEEKNVPYVFLNKIYQDAQGNLYFNNEKLLTKDVSKACPGDPL